MKNIDIHEFVSNHHYKDVKYRYGLLYYYDRVVFEKIENIQELSLNYLIQGWIFGLDHQVHIFEDKQGLKAVAFDAQEDGQNFLKHEQQLLDSRFSHLGKVLVVNKYWIEDDDGQVFMDYQQLSDIVR